MTDFIEAMIPISICVILPIAIVFLSMYPRINNDNKRTQIILKALDSGNAIDADKLAETLNREEKKPYDPRKILYRRLLYGCICIFLGITAIAIEILYTYAQPDFPWELGFFFILGGGIFLSFGLGFLLVYYISRKHIKE